MGADRSTSAGLGREDPGEKELPVTSGWLEPHPGFEFKRSLYPVVFASLDHRLLAEIPPGSSMEGCAVGPVVSLRSTTGYLCCDPSEIFEP